MTKTDVYVIGLIVLIFGIFAFSVAMELAKFIALVKWIVT